MKFLTLMVLGMLSANAQSVSVERVYRPGDTIRLQIVFEGANVSELQGIKIALYANKPASENERGLLTQLSGGESKRVSENTFEASFQIPENAATEDYALVLLVSAPNRTLQYTSPKDFAAQVFHIANPNHSGSPKIKTLTVK
jgi:hypothetical protein